MVEETPDTESAMGAMMGFSTFGSQKRKSKSHPFKSNSLPSISASDVSPAPPHQDNAVSGVSPLSGPTLKKVKLETDSHITTPYSSTTSASQSSNFYSNNTSNWQNIYPQPQQSLKASSSLQGLGQHNQAHHAESQRPLISTSLPSLSPSITNTSNAATSINHPLPERLNQSQNTSDFSPNSNSNARHQKRFQTETYTSPSGTILDHSELDLYARGEKTITKVDNSGREYQVRVFFKPGFIDENPWARFEGASASRSGPKSGQNSRAKNESGSKMEK